MMCDIKKRSGFGKLVNYANNKKKAILIDYKDVRVDNNTTIATSMQGQADDKPRRKLSNPVYHISLNFSKEDSSKLSDELMAEIAREYMEQMGIRNTQYIVCRHTDTEHPHLHIVANRVDNDGNTISDRNDIHRGIKICKDLTKKYGLHMADGKKNVNRNRLKGDDRIRYFIYDRLNEHISNLRSWKGLESKLRDDGIDMKFHYDDETGLVNGVSFSMDGRSFSGSKIDKEMSFHAIDKRLIWSINDKKIYGDWSQFSTDVSPDTSGYNDSISSEIEAKNVENSSRNSFSTSLKIDNDIAKNNNDITAKSSNDSTNSDDTSSISDIAISVGEAINELVMQPHQAPVSAGGGGGNDNGDWGDEDKKKRKSGRRR